MLPSLSSFPAWKITSTLKSRLRSKKRKVLYFVFGQFRCNSLQLQYQPCCIFSGWYHRSDLQISEICKFLRTIIQLYCAQYSVIAMSGVLWYSVHSNLLHRCHLDIKLWGKPGNKNYLLSLLLVCDSPFRGAFMIWFCLKKSCIRIDRLKTGSFLVLKS